MFLYEIIGQVICATFFASSLFFGFLAYVNYEEEEGSLIAVLFCSILLIISIFITYTSYKKPEIVGGLIVELIKSLIGIIL